MATVKKRRWRTTDGKEHSAFRVSYTVKGVRLRKQFKTKAEADAFRLDIERRIADRTYKVASEKMTTRDLAALYVSDLDKQLLAGEITRRHKEMVEGRIGNYIAIDPTRSERRKGKSRVTPFKNDLGDRLIKELAAPDVKTFARDLKAAGVSVATTRKIVGTLCAMLNFGVGENYLAVNVARGAKVKKKRDDGPKKKKIVPPSREDLRRIIAAADEDFQVVMRFAASTGLRAGEMHALRWKHICLDAGTVIVETRLDAYNEEGGVKSEAGYREVPIGPAVVVMLREWRVRSRFSREGDLVFPNKKGRYVRHTHLLHDRFDPLWAKLAKLHAEAPDDHPAPPPKFNWHMLRHYCVSQWIASGAPPKAIQTWAGHSSLQLTMTLYGHFYPEQHHHELAESASKALFV